MTTKDEALKLALEALENTHDVGCQQTDDAITTLRTAIEAAEKQEPVAYVVTTEVHGQMCSFIHRIDLTKLLPDGAKLYTTQPAAQPAPAQEPAESPDDWSDWKVTPPAAHRQWVGLTDEDVYPLANENLHYQIEGYEVSGIYNLARAIESKLKEKNT